MNWDRLVLDIGCRFGIFSHELARNNKDALVIGVDKSKEDIKKAKKNFKLENLIFICEDLKNLPELTLTSTKYGDKITIAGLENKIMGMDLLFDEVHAHYILPSDKINEKHTRDIIRVCALMLRKGGTLIHSAEYDIKPGMDKVLRRLLGEYDLKFVDSSKFVAFTTAAKRLRDSYKKNLNLTVWAKKE